MEGGQEESKSIEYFPSSYYPEMSQEIEQMESTDLLESDEATNSVSNYLTQPDFT